MICLRRVSASCFSRLESTNRFLSGENGRSLGGAGTTQPSSWRALNERDGAKPWREPVRLPTAYQLVPTQQIRVQKIWLRRCYQPAR